MFREILGLLAPKLLRRSRRRSSKTTAAERVSGSNFAPTGGGDGVGDPKVLLANLADDSGGAVTGRLSEIFSSCDALEVYRTNKPIKQSNDADVVRRLLVAVDKGREWLFKQQADILVWGEVEGDNVRLRFVPKIPCTDTLPGAFGLGDTLELPDSLLEQSASVV